LFRKSALDLIVGIDSTPSSIDTKIIAEYLYIVKEEQRDGMERMARLPKAERCPQAARGYGQRP
jgi:hypothetical protein